MLKSKPLFANCALGQAAHIKARQMNINKPKPNTHSRTPIPTQRVLVVKIVRGSALLELRLPLSLPSFSLPFPPLPRATRYKTNLRSRNSTTKSSENSQLQTEQKQKRPWKKNTQSKPPERKQKHAKIKIPNFWAQHMHVNKWRGIWPISEVKNTRLTGAPATTTITILTAARFFPRQTKKGQQ